jgi:hypothetical protein
MRWRPVAASAAGVVALLGLGAGKAAADASDEAVDAPTTTTSTTVAPEPTGREDRLAQANELLAVEAQLPPPKPKPAPPVTPVLATPVEQPAAADPVVAGVVTPAPVHAPNSSDESAVFPSIRPTSSPVATAAPASPSPAAAAPSPEPAPADNSKPSTPTPPTQPATAATATTVTGKSTDAAPPSTAAVLQPEDVWWPAWTEELVDQRIAAAWRQTPVRGPPPGTASALGNDGRTTITQVAIVDGPDGVEVTVSTGQTANVNSVGFAQAEAHGPGDARATGDKATTSIYQTSVVVRKGTGTATVEQDANVDNLGYAIAATAGADADAVGNASSTTIHQTAVVMILGSGDGTIDQTANVRNAGGATAVGTDKPASAAGNRSSTDVNQIAVVVVHDEDQTLTQTSTTDNIGLATAIGATSTGNTATNTVEQVAALKS